VNDIIFTGNLIVDYVSPMYCGNFNIMSGKSNLGQKQLLNSAAINFLNKDNSLVIYVTFSKREANKLTELVNKNNLNQNFVIFTLSDKQSQSEYYFLPRIALNYAREVIKENSHSKNENSLSILFCIDDVTNNILQEKNIFQTAKTISPSNIFAEIYEETGNFSNYSFSTLLIAEKSRMNLEFEEEYTKIINNLYSFSDKILNFEPNFQLLKSKI
jgi:hypothetical protein